MTFRAQASTPQHSHCHPQVSLDGLVLNNPNSQRTLKKYPLNYISRWALRGSSLVRASGMCLQAYITCCLHAQRATVFSLAFTCSFPLQVLYTRTPTDVEEVRHPGGQTPKCDCPSDCSFSCSKLSVARGVHIRTCVSVSAADAHIGSG